MVCNCGKFEHDERMDGSVYSNSLSIRAHVSFIVYNAPNVLLSFTMQEERVSLLSRCLSLISNQI